MIETAGSGKGILELPITSLTQELKCAKARLGMVLSESGHITVQSAAPTVSAGRKLNPQ